MSIYTLLQRRAAILALAAGALLPSVVAAQTSQAGSAPGKWQFAATLYGYFPSFGGSTSFPANSGGGPIDVSSDKVIDSLKMAFMGSLGAHNGKWGMFTDVIYFDVGGSKSQSRDFSIGSAGVPAGVTADLNLDLKAVLWMLAGEYRIVSNPAWTMDVLAGARMLDVKEELNWGLSGTVGTTSRTGRSEVSGKNWDAIVGVKGRYILGAGGRLSLPYYLDVGTGDSDLTWQGAGGVAYAFSWGELSAMYRYIEYNMKSGSKIQDLTTSGPMIGATFRW